jgi:hypothetical protein
VTAEAIAAVQRAKELAVATTMPPGKVSRILGIILLAGGAIFAVSPLLFVAIGCHGASSDSGCGAGAIVMIMTVPFGGLIALAGAILLIVSAARKARYQRTVALDQAGQLPSSNP